MIQAVALVESGNNPQAVSKAGARGLMQFMPKTAKEYGIDPHDPVQSVTAAKRKLSGLMTRYKDLRLALAAYNAGETRVDAAIKRAGSRSWMDIAPLLPRETRAYPGKVMGAMRKFESQVEV